jgi:hypothetical protein
MFGGDDVLITGTISVDENGIDIVDAKIKYNDKIKEYNMQKVVIRNGDWSEFKQVEGLIRFDYKRDIYNTIFSITVEDKYGRHNYNILKQDNDTLKEFCKEKLNIELVFEDVQVISTFQEFKKWLIKINKLNYAPYKFEIEKNSCLDHILSENAKMYRPFVLNGEFKTIKEIEEMYNVKFELDV